MYNINDSLYREFFIIIIIWFIKMVTSFSSP